MPLKLEHFSSAEYLPALSAPPHSSPLCMSTTLVVCEQIHTQKKTDVARAQFYPTKYSISVSDLLIFMPLKELQCSHKSDHRITAVSN